MEDSKKLLCRIFGCKPPRFHANVDKFLNEQFDPSGIHILHSHYRPAAIWPRAIQWGHDVPYMAFCKRCHSEIWKFYPDQLSGKTYCKADSYELRKSILDFEKKFFGIDQWRVK